MVDSYYHNVVMVAGRSYQPTVATSGVDMFSHAHKAIDTS